MLVLFILLVIVGCDCE
ncbi:MULTISPECIES: sporulation protein YjcZ [Bacillales]|nr:MULTISPECIES: sporulation protein YjcZ [Bacillales]